jgi:hypothetical protein
MTITEMFGVQWVVEAALHARKCEGNKGVKSWARTIKSCLAGCKTKKARRELAREFLKTFASDKRKNHQP